MADTATMKGAATGATTGAGIGTLILPGVGTAIGAGVGALAGGAIGYYGSSEERNIRKGMEADTKRMAGGGGGMSAGKMQQMQAQGMGQINAQQQQALAQMARGNAMGGGESGIQTVRQGNVYQGAMQAGQQLQSSIREQDLLYAQQQRALNRQLQMAMAEKDEKRTEETYNQLAQLANTAAAPGQAQIAQNVGAGQRAAAAQNLSGQWAPAPTTATTTSSAALPAG